MIPWWLASLLSNAAIMFVEYTNRAQPDLGSAMSRTWPMIVLAQIGLFFCWNGAPSFMFAWAFFSVGNSIMRVTVATTWLDEPLRLTPTLLGIALMIGGAALVKIGTSAT